MAYINNRIGGFTFIIYTKNIGHFGWNDSKKMDPENWIHH